MKSNSKLSFLVLSIIGNLLCACAIGPDYSRPDLQLPPHYQEPTIEGDVIANMPWWELFKDEALQSLINIALVENKNLEIATARVEASRAILGFTRADQFPQIGYSGEAQRTGVSDEELSLLHKPVNHFGLFGDLSFELDIWGRLRRATEAQRAELLSSEYAKRAVIVSLLSQVATGYLRIIGIDDRLGISRGTYKNRQGSTNLINERFKKGVIPQLDLNQAEIEQETAGAAVSVLERQRKQAENALSVLLGRAPFSIPVGQPLEKQTFTENIPSGFPAALLERRPDVLAAEESTKAAVARIGVAEAGRLPTFDLLGFIGIASKDSNDLFHGDAFTWNIGGNMVGPLIDWGKSSSQVDLAHAEAHAAFAQYEQTVLVSVQEVEDALVAIRTYKQELDHRRLQINASKNASKLSWARYDNGESSYIDVLDVERSLFQAELDASIAQESYFDSIIALYKALGGGWDPQTPVN
jgi:multidrug efflux system outer membrane protein